MLAQACHAKLDLSSRPLMLMVILMIIGRRQRMTKQLHGPILLCILAMFCAPDAARAELVRFEVLEIESPYFDGRSFGAVG